MSNISNRHTVNPFVAGKSEPLATQRLIKVGYKKTADNPNPPKSICVSVPVIDVKEAITDFTPWFPHIRAMMESAQDGIVRALYESSGHQLQTVTDDDISPASILAYLDMQASGGRSTGEPVTNWFEQKIKDSLTVLIADKLGFSELTEDNMVTIGKHLSGYKALFVSLSGGKTLLLDHQINQLERVIQLFGSDDSVTAQLSVRLNNMKKKDKIETLLDL